jgi:hypothetical protein
MAVDIQAGKMWHKLNAKYENTKRKNKMSDRPEESM